MCKKIIFSNIWIFTLIYSSNILACINTYSFDLGSHHLSVDYAQQEIQKFEIDTKASTLAYLEQMNDLAVLHIYAKQYVEAITILKTLEHDFPKQSKVAANLGTAYELNGQIKYAKYWIEQGILRDKNIHEGSEWIHVKILEAQLSQQQNKMWLSHNDVLGLDFSQNRLPVAKVHKVNYQNLEFDLSNVLEHSKLQMNQRLGFIGGKQQEPITAQILFNMANIEMVQGNFEDAIYLYERADSLGYLNKKLLDQRVELIIENPFWLHLTMRIYGVWQWFVGLF